MTATRATLRVLKNRSVAAAELGFLAFTLVLHGAWVALLVYAFEQGGVAEAGYVAFAVLVPGALAAPFVAVWYDRLPPRFGLAVGFALQAAALGLVAAAVATGAPPPAVYGGMMAVTINQMASRPTLSATLPRTVHDPEELSAANAAAGVIETAGLFLGPSFAGLVLFSTSNRSAPFIVSALAMAAAAAVALTIEQVNEDLEEAEAAESVIRLVRGGLGLLRRESGPRHLVIVMSTSRLVSGALEVGFVAIALDQLSRSEATAGLLGSAIGVGAIVGSALSFLLVGRRRLSLPIAAASLLVALPLIMLSQATSLVVVIVLLALSGIGRPVLEVGGRTMLQGLSADDTLAQIFGMLEGLSLLAVALGSIGFSQLAAVTSLPTALITVGLLPPIFLAVQYAKLRRIDLARPEISPKLLALVRQAPIFAPLPAFQLEQMLMNMHHIQIPADDVIFSEGDHGDQIYLVSGGSAIIELADREVETSAGGFFGEIAIIRDQPRMATVRAGHGGLEAYALERDVFLDAISQTNRSHTRTHRIAEHRLGER